MLQIERFAPYCPGRQTRNFIHPSLAEVNGVWIMTLQEMRGSDFYGQVEYTISMDQGKNWSPPLPLPAFLLQKKSQAITEGIADTRLFPLPDGKSVIAFACNTYYSPKGAISWDQSAHKDVPTPQYAVYSIFRDGQWSERKKLKVPSFADGCNYRTACTQIAFESATDMIIPVYFTCGKVNYYGFDSDAYAAMTVKARLHDDELEVYAWSNVLSHDAGRGFIEPSTVFFRDRYHLTLRAEDGRAYHCESSDALHWSPPRAWSFDHGIPLETDTTQQHWLKLHDRLFLLYTRKTPANSHLMRFRAPLFIAEFDVAQDVLLLESEKIVFPQQKKDGLENLLGNFHVTAITENRAIVSDSGLFLRTENHEIIDLFSEVYLAEVRLKASYQNKTSATIEPD